MLYAAIALLFLLVLAVGLSYFCFFAVFLSRRKREDGTGEYHLPPGEAFRPFHPQMIAWIDAMRALPYRLCETCARDGLTLRGRYYETDPAAPIEILFHGYRGDPERDMSGAIERAFAVGHNALVVSQRAAGESEGRVITFGIRERWDCLSWVDYVIKAFGPSVRIMLSGVSMGAATVLMAAGEPLPENVYAILADCPYSSARDIIMTVMRSRRLPARLLYPFVRLGARLFGHFDPDETSPLSAIARTRLPVILYHGEADGFVPCEMSRRLSAAAAAPCHLITVPGADHALAYPRDPEAYLNALREFEAGLRL
ncbi:MAG: alpha/beta hydrolase [Clostridia bacterium]|nr:alpha/beta hydrolase [Clostridia bacterium]